MYSFKTIQHPKTLWDTQKFFNQHPESHVFPVASGMDKLMEGDSFVLPKKASNHRFGWYARGFLTKDK